VEDEGSGVGDVGVWILLLGVAFERRVGRSGTLRPDGLDSPV